MSLSRQHTSILNAIEKYRNFLDTVSEEEFQRNPAEGVWSWSEVYSHIFQSNLGCLIAIEKCINKTGEYSSKRINLVAWAILFFGKFPPGKIKAPAAIASMVNKIDKEQARNLISKFTWRLEKIYPQVCKAPADQKVKHPRLGLLNAKQWFRFIEIHSHHHLKQLERIKSGLNLMKPETAFN